MDSELWMRLMGCGIAGYLLQRSQVYSDDFFDGFKFVAVAAQLLEDNSSKQQQHREQQRTSASAAEQQHQQQNRAEAWLSTPHRPRSQKPCVFTGLTVSVWTKPQRLGHECRCPAALSFLNPRLANLATRS